MCVCVLGTDEKEHYEGEMTSDPHPYVPDLLESRLIIASEIESSQSD